MGSQLTHHGELTKTDDALLEEQLIRKFDRDIQESTGLDVIGKKN